MGVQERVNAVVLPILADLGCDLYDLEASGNLVRITVDRVGGVDLGTLSLITRLVSRELDEQDPLPGAYTLEVSSPGLERTLRRPDHYRSAIGKDVAIRTLPGVDGPRRVDGVLLGADDDGIVVRLEPSGPDLVERRLAYGQIERARTTFSWGGQPKPGKPGAAKPDKPAATKPEKPGASKAGKPAASKAGKPRPSGKNGAPRTGTEPDTATERPDHPDGGTSASPAPSSQASTDSRRAS
jgi:ribosome maturation factor RimP